MLFSNFCGRMQLFLSCEYLGGKLSVRTSAPVWCDKELPEGFSKGIMPTQCMEVRDGPQPLQHLTLPFSFILVRVSHCGFHWHFAEDLLYMLDTLPCYWACLDLLWCGICLSLLPSFNWIILQIFSCICLCFSFLFYFFS